MTDITMLSDAQLEAMVAEGIKRSGDTVVGLLEEPDGGDQQHSAMIADLQREALALAGDACVVPAQMKSMLAAEWELAKCRSMIRLLVNALELKRPADSLVSLLARIITTLDDDLRLELFGAYCRSCGCPDPGCQCWNDE